MYHIGRIKAPCPVVSWWDSLEACRKLSMCAVMVVEVEETETSWNNSSGGIRGKYGEGKSIPGEAWCSVFEQVLQVTLMHIKV